MTKEKATKKAKAALNIQMDPDDYAKLKAIADADRRSLASYVRDVLIAEAIEKHGTKE